MAKLKDRLIGLRGKFDLTQEQVADLSGISQRQISRYEKGGDASGEHLMKLAKAFGVSTDYLLGYTEESEDDLAPKERLVLGAWRRGERLEAIRVIVEDD